MSYATSQIQFRILCFVNKAWTCFCLHIFVILVNNSFKSCFSVFIKCVINTMTQFILLVISHLFKIWLYSIHVLIAKKNTLYMYHCTIVVSKTKTYKLCYFYLGFWHSNVGHSRHWKRKDWCSVILSSNRVYVHSTRSCLLQFNIDSSINYSLFSFSTFWHQQVSSFCYDS